MRRNTWPKESLLSEKTAEALGRSEASVGPPQTPDAHYVNTYLQKTKARTETDSRRLTNIDTENGDCIRHARADAGGVKKPLREGRGNAPIKLGSSLASPSGKI